MNGNPFDARDVQSRRGGRVKQPLSRELIVTEALRQLRKDGLEGMSLRKVAAALDTGPASLYAYVDDLHSLNALVLDRALGDVEIGAGGKKRDWRGRLKSVLASYMRVLLESRGLAQLGMSGVAVGPHALRILDVLLALLEEGGFGPTSAAWTVDLLLLYVNAIAAEQTNGHDPVNPEGPFLRAIESASSETYPHVFALRDQLLSGDGEARFSWAIDTILGGVRDGGKPSAKKKAVKKKGK